MADNDEALQLRKNFAKHLLPAYRNAPVEIAKLCDEILDRTGNLLGYIRELDRHGTFRGVKQEDVYHG